MKIIILVLCSKKKGEESLLLNKNELKNFKIERKFNSEKLKNCLKFAGVNPNDSILIINSIKSHFLECKEDEKLYKEIIDNTMKVYIHKSLFNSLLKVEFNKLALKKKDMFKKDFKLAYDVIEQKISVIILLGGASGTGKSSIAAHLAYSLSVANVLSTDSIRHIMRNFMLKEENPLLFCSTYETHKQINDEENKDLPDVKKCLIGFKIQSAMVQERLEKIIESYDQNNESIIIEGVHLTPNFMLKMVKKYKNCLPFEIFISNESKHRERFSVRSKYMTLDKKSNKYVENFKYIRTIQKYCTMKAEELQIPKIDNSNVDKSMGIAHRLILRYLKKVYFKKSLIIQQDKITNASHILEQFNRITKNVWSSDSVKKYILEKKDGKLENEVVIDLDEMPKSNQKIKSKNYAEDSNSKETLKSAIFECEPEIQNSEKDLTAKEFDSKEEEVKSEDDGKNKFKSASIDLSQFIDLIRTKNCLSISSNIRSSTLRLIKKYVAEFNLQAEKDSESMKLKVLKTNKRYMIVQDLPDLEWQKTKEKIFTSKEFMMNVANLSSGDDEIFVKKEFPFNSEALESKVNASDKDKDSIKNFNSIGEESVEEEIECFLEDGFNSIDISDGNNVTEEQSSGQEFPNDSEDSEENPE